MRLWASGVALLILTSCPKPLLQPLDWHTFPSYQAPEASALVGHDPVSLLQGEETPWDGVLLHPDDLTSLLSDRDRLISALAASYTGRGEDRTYASQSLSSCQTAIEVCRANLPRAFAAGAASGAAGCGVVVAGVAGSR